MTGTGFFAAAVMALFSAAVTGCSGASSDGSSTTSDPSTAASFEGTYVGDGNGPIAAMRFDSNGYAVVPTGCTKASCTDVGSFSVDASGTSLSIKSALTGETRTLSVDVTSSEPSTTSSTSTASSVHVEDLVSGSGSSIVKSGGPIVNTVNSALVNGQKVELVAALSWCASNIPTGYGDPGGGKQAAYWAMCPNGPLT